MKDVCNARVGDMVIAQIPARIWDDNINETLATFRHGDVGIVLEVRADRQYLKIFTNRRKIGWVLRALVCDSPV
jgi:hypothetical protein